MKTFTNIAIIIMIWALMETRNLDLNIKGLVQEVTKLRKTNIKKYTPIKVNILKCPNFSISNPMKRMSILMR
jgi:hypothetical protein